MATSFISVKYRVSPDTQTLLSQVKRIADAADRPVRPLQLQALLQLPRLADQAGFISALMAETLARELAEELPLTRDWLVGTVASPRALLFHLLEVAQAADVMQRFHYLRSPRTDGRCYGLSTNSGQLVALCVTSPLDVGTLRQLLRQQGRNTETARVVSRVFAFPAAPKNSISYLLSRASKKEAMLGVTDLITYVNPNMGFTGSSYLASGWKLLGHEHGTKYRYLDDRYITDRELHVRFGTKEDDAYRRTLGPRFSTSRMHLEPLLVFGTTCKQ